MKLKTRKSIKKRYSESNPKHGKSPKISHVAQGFSHNAGKKRKFRQFRGRNAKVLSTKSQSDKIIKSI